MKFISFILIFFLSILSFAVVEKANSEEGIMRFEYRVINRSTETENINFYFTLPRNNERQEVFLVYPEPGFKKIMRDKYGILNIKNNIIKKNDTNYNKALLIYKYLINNIKYYRDDVWEPAPDVLKHKQGSCSEFNYTLVSLLRASGIPARYTGAFTIKPSKTTKYDKYIQEDAVFHRWTEVFTLDYGWVPFDASRGSGSIRRSGNYLDYVGRIPAGALQTYRGDGGKDNMLRWDYISNARSSSGSKIKDIPVGYYISFKKTYGSLEESIVKVKKAVKPKLTEENIAKLLKNPIDRETLFLFKNYIKKDMYPIMIKELIKIGHPEAIYYSLYLNHLKLKKSDSLKYSNFTEKFLMDSIKKFLNTEKWDWYKFEYWWRKARPYVKFDKKSNLFVLTKKDINIY